MSFAGALAFAGLCIMGAGAVGAAAWGDPKIAFPGVTVGFVFLVIAMGIAEINKSKDDTP